MSSLTKTSPGQKEKICPHCQTTFYAWPSEERREYGTFCGAGCARRGRALIAVEDRFWKHVRKSEDPNECWLWTGANSGGKWPYGIMGNGKSKKLLKAHHVSFQISTTYPVPKDFLVLHHCDVTLCVNPKHLFLGNAADNMQDMAQKGRAKGGRPKGTRLSPESLASFREKRGFNSGND